MPCSAPIASEAYADFIARYQTSPEEFLASYGNGCVDFINSEQAVVYAPLESVLPLTLSRYPYSSIPKLYSLLDTVALEAAGIFQASSLPAFGNGGKGVLIGFVDTGINYKSPAFQNLYGETRILGLWDQTGEGGRTQDAGFSPLYGTFYTHEDINLALRSENPESIVPSSDDNGHGTALASLAAGTPDEEAGFSGAAPLASLAIVKLKPAKQYLKDFFLTKEGADVYQENDIMMGLSYLYALSRRYSMPLVLCLCLGTNQGSHAGTSPLSRYLNSLSVSSGLAVLTAAGNETGFSHHYLGLVGSGGEIRDAELRVGEGERGFSLEFWAQDLEIYTVGFVSPAGEVVRPLPVSRDDQTVSFLLDQTTITVSYQSSDLAAGNQLIFMRFEAPSFGIWRIRIQAALEFQSVFHMWLPCRGQIGDGTVFLRPDPDSTLTDPATAAYPISVTAFEPRTGAVYIHASRGYSLLGQVKPELAAPGVEIVSVSSSGPPFSRITGTSAAAALAAGACAILLHWGLLQGNYPYMNTAVLKTLLIRGAKRNPELLYPNREFGYGALDLYQSFLQLRG